ncbi:CBO0543 family protein [Paenibacillus sp. WC2504]|uniref:CBO0543 family protein n=1 Tax=Paenibacillus sp. WC2504 TaxID=3461403 RepID=UPI0040461A88
MLNRDELLDEIVHVHLADKKRLIDIVLFGDIMSFLIFLLDHIGCELNLWVYPHKLFPVIPESSAFDLGILPALHMLLFQFFTKWRSYLIANILMATVFAFLCEPISVWIGLYKTLHWRYIYSFPLYILKALIIKWIFEIVQRKQNSLTSLGMI